MAIDFGAFVSMFACVLACATAAARVLMRMAHDGLLPAALERTNRRHGTPGTAVALSTALMFAATAGLALRGATGSAMYDLLGSLSVFGFLTAYALVALALPFARRALGTAFSRACRRQRLHRRCDPSDRGLRSRLRRRRGSRAHSLSLSRLHCRGTGWYGVRRTIVCKSLTSCGKRARNGPDLMPNPYMNFMPQTLTFL